MPHLMAFTRNRLYILWGHSWALCLALLLVHSWVSPSRPPKGHGGHWGQPSACLALSDGSWDYYYILLLPPDDISSLRLRLFRLLRHPSCLSYTRLFYKNLHEVQLFLSPDWRHLEPSLSPSMLRHRPTWGLFTCYLDYYCIVHPLDYTDDE